MLWRCDTIRLGLTGADGPYVVPVSFGLDLSGEKPVVYFHCARKGMKVDLLEYDKRVRIYRIALDTITGKRNLPGSE